VWAVQQHAGQRREADRAAFVAHPMEVAPVGVDRRAGGNNAAMADDDVTDDRSEADQSMTDVFRGFAAS
jgi:hypothetical protein